MATQTTICKYNQMGFCKYRQQCTKMHVNEVCKKHLQCKDSTCTLRHPKKCKTFSAFGNCKFVKCAYFHVKDEVDLKVEMLENYVKKLKEEVLQLNQNSQKYDEKKIAGLERELQTLKEDVSNLTISIKTTEKLVKDLSTKYKATKDRATMKEGEKIQKCDICDYKCKKTVTLNKHINTKHPRIGVKCDKRQKTLQRKENIEQHKESEYKSNIESKADIETENDTQNDIKTDISECSICEDKFLTEEEYTHHIQEHLEEIKDIDIEFLKNGHEIFDCSSCHFQSNKPEAIKRHLKQHVLQPKDRLKMKSKCKKYKETMLKSKNWRDMYDDQDNPIFDSSDSNTSSEYED